MSTELDKNAEVHKFQGYLSRVHPDARPGLWDVWMAAKAEAFAENHACVKREASTEPSKTYYEIREKGKVVECGMASVSAAALPDEAKDAARYRFLRHADLDAIAAGSWRTGRVLDGAKFDDVIDAAIEAQKGGQHG